MSILLDSNHRHYLILKKNRNKFSKTKKHSCRDEILKEGYTLTRFSNYLFIGTKVKRGNFTAQQWYRYVRLNKI